MVIHQRRSFQRIPKNQYNDEVNKIKLTILLRDGLRKPVFNSRDTQEVPLEESVQMMDKIEKYLNTNTILEHFEYYDLRQENYEKSNPQLNQISTL